MTEIRKPGYPVNHLETALTNFHKLIKYTFPDVDTSRIKGVGVPLGYQSTSDDPYEDLNTQIRVVLVDPSKPSGRKYMLYRYRRVAPLPTGTVGTIEVTRETTTREVLEKITNLGTIRAELDNALISRPLETLEGMSKEEITAAVEELIGIYDDNGYHDLFRHADREVLQTPWFKDQYWRQLQRIRVMPKNESLTYNLPLTVNIRDVSPAIPLFDDLDDHNNFKPGTTTEAQAAARTSPALGREVDNPEPNFYSISFDDVTNEFKMPISFTEKDGLNITELFKWKSTDLSNKTLTVTVDPREIMRMLDENQGGAVVNWLMAQMENQIAVKRNNYTDNVEVTKGEGTDSVETLNHFTPELPAAISVMNGELFIAAKDREHRASQWVYTGFKKPEYTYLDLDGGVHNAKELLAGLGDNVGGFGTRLTDLSKVIVFEENYRHDGEEVTYKQEGTTASKTRTRVASDLHQGFKVPVVYTLNKWVAENTLAGSEIYAVPEENIGGDEDNQWKLRTPRQLLDFALTTADFDGSSESTQGLTWFNANDVDLKAKLTEYAVNHNTSNVGLVLRGRDTDVLVNNESGYFQFKAVKVATALELEHPGFTYNG